MDKRSIINNLGIAFSAQSMAMLVSALMSLLIPKILGIVEFGYWQLFIFYVGYSGFFLFGLNDGIYLEEGGLTRKEVDKKAIASQFVAASIMQFVVGICIGIIAYILYQFDSNRLFVAIFTAIYILLFNLSGMLGYVFQSLNETRLFSFSILLDRLVFLVSMLALIFIKVESFRLYVIFYTIAKLICMVYCLFNGRSFFNEGLYAPSKTIVLCIRSIVIGLPLMLSTILDGLIMGVPRMLIDSSFGIAAFGKVSFSLSLTSFFTAFVMQVAMVLFPALRQSSQEELLKFYNSARDAMEVVFPVAYVLYFPMVMLIENWLPQYHDSLHYFAILLPYCVFNARMNICATTYFKVLNKVHTLFIINASTVIISSIISVIGIKIVHSIELVLYGVAIIAIIRSYIAELFINNELQARPSRIVVIEVSLSVIFVVIAANHNPFIGFCTVGLLYLSYICLNRESFKKLFNYFHF